MKVQWESANEMGCWRFSGNQPMRRSVGGLVGISQCIECSVLCAEVNCCFLYLSVLSREGYFGVYFGKCFMLYISNVFAEPQGGNPVGLYKLILLARLDGIDSFLFFLNLWCRNDHCLRQREIYTKKLVKSSHSSARIIRPFTFT